MELSADELLGEVSKDGLRRIYCALCRLAHCDGSVDPKEREVLEAYRQWFAIGREEAVELEMASAATDALRIGKKKAEHDLLVCAMIDVASADGKIAKAEADRILRIGTVVGLSKDELLQNLEQVGPLPGTRVFDASKVRTAAPGTGGPPIETLSEDGKRRIYVILSRLAHCDGVQAAEQKVLERWRERLEIPPKEADLLENEGRTSPDLRVGKAPGERAVLVHAMVDIVAADGVVSDNEQNRLLRIGGLVGLKDEIVASLKNRVPAAEKPEKPEEKKTQERPVAVTDSGRLPTEREGGESSFELRSVDTAWGPVKVHFLPTKLAKGLEKGWPHGVFPFAPGEPAPAGVRFRIGVTRHNGEIPGVRLLQQELSENDARTAERINALRLGHAIARYLEAGFTGVLLVGTTLGRTPAGALAPGFFVLAAPGVARKDREERPVGGYGHPVLPRDAVDLDRNVGPGAANMIAVLLDKLGKGDAEPGMPLMTPIASLELRPKVPTLEMTLGFLVSARQVYALMPEVRDEDPIWAALSSGGLRHVLHMPSVAR